VGARSTRRASRFVRDHLEDRRGDAMQGSDTPASRASSTATSSMACSPERRLEAAWVAGPDGHHDGGGPGLAALSAWRVQAGVTSPGAPLGAPTHVPACCGCLPGLRRPCGISRSTPGKDDRCPHQQYGQPTHYSLHSAGTNGPDSATIPRFRIEGARRLYRKALLVSHGVILCVGTGRLVGRPV
jgi:hypothetical protein